MHDPTFSSIRFSAAPDHPSRVCFSCLRCVARSVRSHALFLRLSTKADHRMNLRADKILESDHADLNKLQADVQRSLAGDDLHRTHEALDLFWGRLALHIRAEHLRLFPALFSVNKSSGLSELISLLREDHDFFMTELGSLIT